MSLSLIYAANNPNCPDQTRLKGAQSVIPQSTVTP